MLIGTWRPRRPGADNELIELKRVHWLGRDRCTMPVEQLDPKTWRPR
jgi:hypothetical protein